MDIDSRGDTYSKTPQIRKKRKVEQQEWSTDENEFDVPYESSELQRFPCYNCKSIQSYTRIMNSPNRKIAHYLCYNCTKESKFKGWQLFTVKFKVQKPGCPLFVNNDTNQMITMYPTEGGYSDVPPEKRS